jgi:hypothetical protein
MGKRSTSSKMTTPPKGRPTPKRNPQVGGRSRRALYGWIAVALLIAAIIGVAIYVGADQEIRPFQGVSPVGGPAETPLVHDESMSRSASSTPRWNVGYA